MRLKYSILWFEDNEGYYDAANPDIIEYLEGLGYTPDLERRADDTDLMKIMEEKDVDLMLVDYNLKDELKGDELVNAVRKNELYTEAVFYAQNPQDLSKIQGQYEGVFYAPRSDLLKKTKKIIDLTLKKNQDFNNIRGLFIAETIDMARQMEEIISKILELQEKQHEFFMDQVIQEEFFTDYWKFRIIQRHLKHEIKSLKMELKSTEGPEKIERLKEALGQVERVKAIFNDFEKEVIMVRNRLAHAKICPGKKNTLIWKGKEEKYDDEKCKNIRKLFAKHSQNLNKIVDLLVK